MTIVTGAHSQLLYRRQVSLLSGCAFWCLGKVLPPTFFFFKILCIYFLEGGEGKEKEGEKHRVVASQAPPTGDLAHSPGMCPDQ